MVYWTTLKAATFSTTALRRTVATLVLGSALQSPAHVVASCESSPLDWIKAQTNGSGGDFNIMMDRWATQMGGSIQKAVDSGIPTQLSYGFVSGYCSGLALKKVGKMAAVVFGGGFMVLQTLSYYGYIQVDHTKFAGDFTKSFDLDNDGDVDHDDAKLGMEQIMKVAGYNMPAGGGFTAGFIGGLRSG